jgi:ethanolamine utilization protein EutQ (cupin superfamily)
VELLGRRVPVAPTRAGLGAVRDGTSAKPELGPRGRGDLDPMNPMGPPLRQQWYRRSRVRDEAGRKRIITAATVTAEVAAGRRRIAAPAGRTVITPDAWSRATELRVTFDRSATGASSASPAEDPTGRCERTVDPSGLTVVRGRSVRLGTFAAAGEGRNVGLLDLVTARDGSPMTAGIMSWDRDDSFPWTLDYDEIDLVLEGILQISIDGRVLEGRAGDVFYIPRGSRIVFATPHRVRVFYVTYPADWSAAAAPARPQR